MENQCAPVSASNDSPMRGSGLHPSWSYCSAACNQHTCTGSHLPNQHNRGGIGAATLFDHLCVKKLINVFFHRFIIRWRDTAIALFDRGLIYQRVIMRFYTGAVPLATLTSDGEASR